MAENPNATLPFCHAEKLARRWAAVFRDGLFVLIRTTSRVFKACTCTFSLRVVGPKRPKTRPARPLATAMTIEENSFVRVHQSKAAISCTTKPTYKSEYIDLRFTTGGTWHFEFGLR